MRTKTVKLISLLVGFENVIGLDNGDMILMVTHCVGHLDLSQFSILFVLFLMSQITKENI